jgi:hypothetical protein
MYPWQALKIGIANEIEGENLGTKVTFRCYSKLLFFLTVLCLPDIVLNRTYEISHSLSAAMISPTTFYAFIKSN